MDNATLHAPSNSQYANGVYRYATNGGFPTTSNQATNYWVEPVFQTSVTTTTPQLSVSTGSMNFGSVNINSSSVLSLALTSSGTAPVTVNSASISGTGFSLVAGTFPTTLSPGQSLTLQVSFTPTSAKSFTGAVTITSNSTNGSTTTVGLSGTGVAAASAKLSLSATSLAFGSIAVNSSTTQPLTLTSSGSSALTISSASISGAGFSLVGGSLPITLNAGQSTGLQVQFRPSNSGAASGALSIVSNSSSGSPSVVALSGTGAAIAHSVDLTWQAPPSSPTVITGYNVYRVINGSTNYVLVNPSLIAGTAYTDTGVSGGTTYLYYATSIDQNNVESPPSAIVTVAIP